MDHTLVLRTRNRPQILECTLELYKKFKYEGILYIIDDSTNFEVSSALIARFKSDLSIRHERGAGYDAKTRARRMSWAVNFAFKAITI
jgi:hypothetical protein